MKSAEEILETTARLIGFVPDSPAEEQAVEALLKLAVEQGGLTEGLAAIARVTGAAVQGFTLGSDFVDRTGMGVAVSY